MARGTRLKLGSEDNFRELLSTTRLALERDWNEKAHSACASSCLDCLRSYDNRRLHGALDWRLALDMLDLLAGDALAPSRWFDLGLETARGIASTRLMSLEAGQTEGGVPYLAHRDRGKAVLLGHPLWQRNEDYAVDDQIIAIDELADSLGVERHHAERRLRSPSEASLTAEVAHVTSLAWPEPGGERLSQISPSALNVLLTCPKRLAFQRDSRTKEWVGQSTRTAMGRVAHRLTELVAQGAAPPPPDRREWLEARWEALVQPGEPPHRAGVARPAGTRTEGLARLRRNPGSPAPTAGGPASG